MLVEFCQSLNAIIEDARMIEAEQELCRQLKLLLCKKFRYGIYLTKTVNLQSTNGQRQWHIFQSF